jgi:hypothetical protein
MSRDYPNHFNCILCGVDVEQDDDTRGWFFADNCVYTKPRLSDFTTPYETELGRCCNEECWEDFKNDRNLESQPHHGLFLVKGGAA